MAMGLPRFFVVDMIYRFNEGQMQTRPDSLQDFISALHSALAARAAGPEAEEMLSHAFAALAQPAPAGEEERAQLPVCRHLDSIRQSSAGMPEDLQTLLQAFLTIEPALAWKRRTGSTDAASASFPEGHANALIVGPGGLERRTDVWIGASLLAPDVRYPDHRHPPAETYLILSKGRFSHNHEDWVEPGVGGTFYNAPGILHAMVSGAEPLFAFWILWAQES